MFKKKLGIKELESNELLKTISEKRNKIIDKLSQREKTERESSKKFGLHKAWKFGQRKINYICDTNENNSDIRGLVRVNNNKFTKIYFNIKKEAFDISLLLIRNVLIKS